MIALVLAPSKGEAPYPPLAICSLKAWLSRCGYKSTTIDLNHEYIIKHKELHDQINKFFGRPTTFLNTNCYERIYNLDTIYNLDLLLKFLYYDRYEYDVLNEDEHCFYTILQKQLEQEAESLLKSDFKYVGFSTYVSNVCYSLLLGQTIKKSNPDIKVFFGGSSTAYKPIREFMLQSGIADYVLVGEGENAIAKLISDLETSNPKYSIIYSDNIAPEILMENEIIVPTIKNLDELPFPDFTDLDLDNYTLDYAPNYRFVTMATSRGCVNRCAYCSETQYWKRYRQKSVKRVIEEIEYLYNENHARLFFFCDSLINGNINWLKEFCTQIISKKLNIQWLSYVTLNNINADLLHLMVDSGCVALTFGIEHVNSAVLKGVNKVSSIGDAKSLLMECVDSGIFPIANIIYALPNETPDAFVDLLAFVCDPEIKDKVLFTFRPYEIRVGSVTTNELMQEAEVFPQHDFQLPMADLSLMPIIDELCKFWLPHNDYINITKKKHNIISSYFGGENDEYMWKVANARRYNISQILKRIIKYNSLPKLLTCDNKIHTGLEVFISQYMDGKHTVSAIIKKAEDVIVSKNPQWRHDMVHEQTIKSVIDSFIKISLNNKVIWN